VLKVEDDYTAGYVSKQLGTATVETSNRSREVRPFTGPVLFDERENRGATGRPLMTPDEIINMPASWCIVFLPSPDDHKRVPVQLQTLGYTEFPEVEELERLENNRKDPGKIQPDRILPEEEVMVAVQAAEAKVDKEEVQALEGVAGTSSGQKSSQVPPPESLKRQIQPVHNGDGNTGRKKKKSGRVVVPW